MSRARAARVRIEHYILNDELEVIPCDLWTWALWLEHADRRVARDALGDVTVSTTFVGLNYQDGKGPPLIFETMIFGGPHDGYRTRASTWADAERQHLDALRKATGADEPDYDDSGPRTGS
jgi:hypothetical protein